MKRTLLNSACRELAEKGLWCIPESTLLAYADYPPLRSFRVAMSRHCQAGIINRLGPKLYANPYLRPPVDALYRLANFLRPGEDFYLSTESVLSEHGWISQMPFCLTFVTTGVSYRYSTPLGDLGFTHTEENPQAWAGHLQHNPNRQIWEATPEKALADLRRYGRNLGLLVPEDERE